MVINNIKTAELSRRMALFTDPVRLRLFFFLFDSDNKDFCVSDIAKRLQSSLSNISHQLRKLELAGVIEPKRTGRMICYKVRNTKENKVLYNGLIKLSKSL